MPTRNVSLTDHFDEFVEESIASGRYHNASEVMRDALRLLEQRTQEEALKLEKLREAVKAGFDAVDQGHYEDVAPEDIGRMIAAIGERAAARARRKAG